MGRFIETLTQRLERLQRWTAEKLADAAEGNTRSLKCVSCFGISSRDLTSVGRLLACGHYYCQDCLATFFKMSIGSGYGTYPLCCSVKIPLKHSLFNVLGPENCHHSARMYRDPQYPRRINYCAIPRCSTPLDPRNITGHIGKCRRCGNKTCLQCNSRDHGGGPCSRNLNTEEILELAEQKGWKQCPGCKVMIEHGTGCSSILCSLCDTRFCFRCGKPRRTHECDCGVGGGCALM